MVFGIYPGGVAGTDTGLTNSKPNDPVLIRQALAQLQPDNHNLIVRGYLHDNGSEETADEAPENAEQYITANNTLDLVVCYRSAEPDETIWVSAIKKIIQRYGEKLNSIQITEEPNLKNVFAGDGSFKNIEQALFTGVIAAKEEILRSGLKAKVGFNAILSFDPADTFWNTIGSEEFRPFREAIDYAGLDFFPDVFRPVAADGEPNDLQRSVINVLRYFRYERLEKNGISHSVPIHITENGWPTAEGKTYQRQAEVLEKIIRTVYSLKAELNITQYELFSLRDADSANQDIFHQFGLLKDDYTPKPAFETFKKLIRECQ
jgi:hypothetical protein